MIGNLRLALTECNEPVRLEPNIAATFEFARLGYLKMGQSDSAIADYNAALKLNPK